MLESQPRRPMKLTQVLVTLAKILRLKQIQTMK